MTDVVGSNLDFEISGMSNSGPDETLASRVLPTPPLIVIEVAVLASVAQYRIFVQYRISDGKYDLSISKLSLPVVGIVGA